MLADVVSTAIGGLIERTRTKLETGRETWSSVASTESYGKSVTRAEKKEERARMSDRSKVAFVGQVERIVG